MEQQLKKPFYKKWWFITIAGIFILGVIGSMNDKPLSSTNEAVTKTEQSAPAKQYVEVMRFSGKGQKKSEPFTITGSRFKIAYDCTGDSSATYCGAYVYKVGSKLPQGVMNSAEAIKDETIIYGSGEYYLDANTMGNFSMVVYDYK